jgi:hypothetical protein
MDVREDHSMARTFLVAVVAMAALTGCARGARPDAGPDTEPAAGPAAVKEIGIYSAVVRRYISTPNDNSFPGKTFTTVYVLDGTSAGAGDPMASPGADTPIPEETRGEITADLADVTKVVFIADRDTVLESNGTCPHVKDGAVLMTLGPPTGDDTEVTVAVNGFVACLGATWLTYVVHHDPGVGWKVTGTTGSMAVA